MSLIRTITVGTVIYIPPEHAKGYYDPETGTYLIAQGDDLYKIAKRFGTTVEAIEEANGLDFSKIKAGATLQNNAGYLASLIQFAGTLLFNINTLTKLFLRPMTFAARRKSSRKAATSAKK